MILRYGSVCSGIEAATVAWHPLGWKPAFFSEIDAFPSRVLARQYPLVPNLGDMTRYKEWPDAAINLLVGGTPCQSFSVAGLRKGLADPRGNLALTFLGIADRFNPEWLLWENVPGVLSSDEGRAFGSILGGMAELGYHVSYRVLDAQYIRVDGFGRAVPQRRRRVFVVGNLRDWRRAAAVLFEPESLSGNLAPGRKAGERVAPTISSRPTGGGGLGTDFDCDGGLVADCLQASGKAVGSATQQDAESGLLVPVAFGGNNTSGPIDVATARNAHAGPHGRLDFESETFVAVPFDTTAHPPAIAFDCKASGRNGFGTGDIAPTLRAMGHSGSHQNGGGHQAVAFDMRGREGGAQFEGPHDTANIRAASGGSSRSYVAHTWAVRRLTPIECERLQGFPDGYTDVPPRNKNTTPDGPRYKALGQQHGGQCDAMGWATN